MGVGCVMYAAEDLFNLFQLANGPRCCFVPKHTLNMKGVTLPILDLVCLFSIFM